VSPKTLLLVSFAVSSLVLATGAGCGDDDDEGGAGRAGFSCPKAGDKPCPNDSAVTQATADSCKACEAENKAYSACLGGPKCGADGKTEQPSASQCPTELQALIKCIQGGTSSSGGTDAGGGG
jgi:hypothetical protein